LVSLEELKREGWLRAEDLRPAAGMDAGRVRFEVVWPYREDRLRRAWRRFREAPGSVQRRFRRFCAAQRGWLDDYALYCALKERFDGAPWRDWPEALRRRERKALAAAQRELAGVVDGHRWVQYEFDRQWGVLRRHAARRGVGLIGDLPFFVAPDSADAWVYPELFTLDEEGQPTQGSGYPPDVYCGDGQRWGHPQYNWVEHERTGFRWWVARFAAIFRWFDAVRLDHFLGYTRTWSVPPRGRTARRGRWLETPGEALLGAVRRALGDRPLIAEDLGRVTAADIALRDGLGIPGQRILQMGFGSKDGLHRPHGFVPGCVAYTGTHDTDTVVGWYRSLPGRVQKEVLAYAGSNGERVHWDLIRLTMNSAANTAIVPVQDLAGLGGEARMNRPGTPTGNWDWRMERGELTRGLGRELRGMTELAGRSGGGGF
jgi:4-alpha-glucanotransferase